MAYTVSTLPMEVTFLTPTGAVEIRFSVAQDDGPQRAADALKARFYVQAYAYSPDRMLPIWGVFDRQASLNDNPVKTFVTESRAPAVMYAAMQGKR